MQFCNFFAIWLRMLISVSNDMDIIWSLEFINCFLKVLKGTVYRNTLYFFIIKEKLMVHRLKEILKMSINCDQSERVAINIYQSIEQSQVTFIRGANVLADEILSQVQLGASKEWFITLHYKAKMKMIKFPKHYQRCVAPRGIGAYTPAAKIWNSMFLPLMKKAYGADANTPTALNLHFSSIK